MTSVRSARLEQATNDAAQAILSDAAVGFSQDRRPSWSLRCNASTAPRKFVGGGARRGRFVTATVAGDRTLSYKTSGSKSMTLSARPRIEACGHRDADLSAVVPVDLTPQGAEGGGAVVALGEAAAPHR